MKISKILFLIPPAYTFKKYRDINPLPPIGFGYLASALKGLSIDIKILDCLVMGWDHVEDSGDNSLVRVGLSNKEIRQHLIEFGPELVGVSCTFTRQHKMYHRIFSLSHKLHGVYSVDFFLMRFWG